MRSIRIHTATTYTDYDVIKYSPSAHKFASYDYFLREPRRAEVTVAYSLALRDHLLDNYKMIGDDMYYDNKIEIIEDGTTIFTGWIDISENSMGINHSKDHLTFTIYDNLVIINSCSELLHIPERDTQTLMVNLLELIQSETGIQLTTDINFAPALAQTLSDHLIINGNWFDGARNALIDFIQDNEHLCFNNPYGNQGFNDLQFRGEGIAYNISDSGYVTVFQIVSYRAKPFTGHGYGDWVYTVGSIPFAIINYLDWSFRSDVYDHDNEEWTINSSRFFRGNINEWFAQFGFTPMHFINNDGEDLFSDYADEFEYNANTYKYDYSFPGLTFSGTAMMDKISWGYKEFSLEDIFYTLCLLADIKIYAGGNGTIYIRNRSDANLSISINNFYVKDANIGRIVRKPDFARLKDMLVHDDWEQFDLKSVIESYFGTNPKAFSMVYLENIPISLNDRLWYEGLWWVVSSTNDNKTSQGTVLEAIQQ